MKKKKYIIAAILIVAIIFIVTRPIVQASVEANRRCKSIGAELKHFAIYKGAIDDYYEVSIKVSDDFDNLTPEEMKEFFSDSCLFYNGKTYYSLSEVKTSKHYYQYGHTYSGEDNDEYLNKDGVSILGKSDVDIRNKKENYYEEHPLSEEYPYYGMSEKSIGETVLGEPIYKEISPKNWQDFQTRKWKTTYTFAGNDKIREMKVEITYRWHWSTSFDDYSEYNMGDGKVQAIYYTDNNGVIHSFGIQDEDKFQYGWEP